MFLSSGGETGVAVSTGSASLVGSTVVFVSLVSGVGVLVSSVAAFASTGNASFAPSVDLASAGNASFAALSVDFASSALLESGEDVSLADESFAFLEDLASFTVFLQAQVSFLFPVHLQK